MTDTLPQDSQSTEVLLDDRIPESHGERRTGGLEPIPPHMHYGHTWAPVEKALAAGPVDRTIYGAPDGRVVYECAFCSAEPTTDPDWRGQCARERRTGGLEPIPADMPGALPALEVPAPADAPRGTRTWVLSPAAALELVGKAPGDDYFESGLHRPGSWEWHESRPGEARERLREQGYKPVKDTARPWRVLWTKSS